MNLGTGGWASRVLTPLLRIIRTSPNATVPVIAISEPVNSETAALVNADLALVAKGTGATLAQVPDGTTAGGDKRGQYATDLQKLRVVSSRVASANYGVICGGAHNTASGLGYAIVVGGFANIASYSNSVIVGGSSNTCGGLAASIVGGSNNYLYGTCGVIVGGDNNESMADYACIPGGRCGNTRGIVGYFAFPACNAPISTTRGCSQSSLLVLGRETTNATPTILTSDSSAAGTANQVILPDSSAYSFSGEVIAGVTNGGNTARWTINGAIKRGVGASTIAMVGTPTITKTHNDAGAAAWTVAVTADTTNGGIAVTVTGAASTTIRWVAKINTTEMTY